jgi:hypothetical protein
LAALDGWAWMRAQTQRFTRSLRNQNVVDDDLVSYCYSEAEQKVAQHVRQSGIRWCIKNAVIDDVGLQKGTAIGSSGRRLFVETDLGILDFAKVNKLWRVDPADQSKKSPIFYEGDERGGDGVIYSLETFTEDGDVDAAGNQDLALRISNWGKALTNGLLRVNYWNVPAKIDATAFTTPDANGDFTKRPSLPRPTWIYILNYAHLILLELLEDHAKSTALWRRFAGPTGMEQQINEFLASFVSGTSEPVEDRFYEEGI